MERIMKKILVLLLVTAFGVFLSASAAMINVDLGSGTSVGAGTAGVVASDGWQQKAGSPDITTASSLNLASGGASGATILLDGTGNITSIGAATTDGDYNMFNRGMGIGAAGSGNISNPYNVRISGLSTDFTTSGYDVYVYFGSGINYSGVDVVTPVAVSDGTSTFFVSVSEAQATYQGSYIQGTATIVGDSVLGNYVKFSGLTSSTLSISAIASGASDSVATITGMQIVAIPEPSTMVLVGIALGSLLIFRRRR
jgi:hypothetical protein